MAIVFAATAPIETSAARSQVTRVSPTANLISDRIWSLHKVSDKDTSTLTKKNDVLKLSIDPLLIGQQLTAIFTVTAADKLSPRDNAEIGEALHLHFLARSVAPQGMRVQIIQSKYPYAPTLAEDLEIDQKWREFSFDCIAPVNGDTLSLCFKPKSSVELKEISLRPEEISDLGIPNRDLSKAGIADNIENFRKAPVKILVLDRRGHPVPNALVHIEQTGQKFLFGTQVQGLDPDHPSPSQQNYQKALGTTFNFATVTPYWPQVEFKEGQVKFQQFDRQIDWLSAHGFAIKIHPLFWPHFTPPYVPGNPEQAETFVDRHTQEMAKHFIRFPQVQFFENNEVAAAINDTSSNGVINWVRKIGASKALEHETEIERQACNSARSSTKIVYNDYLADNVELELLEQLEHDGQLPDAIGVQMHMTQGIWPLARVQYIIKKLSRFHRPMYVTEISVLSGDPRVGDDSGHLAKHWPSTADGEKLQAEYVEQLYTLLFSNPSVQGLTWWDLSDKNSWQKAPRGLLRDDMSAKPAYSRINDLIRNQWRTHISLQTNEDGEILQRLFLGEHEITASTKDGSQVKQCVKINEAQGEPVTVRLKVE